MHCRKLENTELQNKKAKHDILITQRLRLMTFYFMSVYLLCAHVCIHTYTHSFNQKRIISMCYFIMYFAQLIIFPFPCQYILMLSKLNPNSNWSIFFQNVFKADLCKPG